jgi:hypothetical protein
MASQSGLSNQNDGNAYITSFGGPSHGSFEETANEVERRLKERRRNAGRPESVDEMSPEQHAAEKLAMQKALLMLEKVCGRATSKQDREIVRPLYDRYRQLKRIVARATSVSFYCIHFPFILYCFHSFTLHSYFSFFDFLVSVKTQGQH